MTRNTPKPPLRDGRLRELEALISGANRAVADLSDLGATEYSANGDEAEFVDKSATFSKGLAQTNLGLVDLAAYRAFRDKLPPGKALNAAPPPPRLTSGESAAELVELYWASLLRDIPFSLYEHDVHARAAARELSGLGDLYRGPRDAEGEVTPRVLFRGGLRRRGKTYFAGESYGPYLSQLALAPARMGAHPLDRKYRVHHAGLDYLVEEAEWAWIQNGGEPREPLCFDPWPRHLKDGRALASCAYDDELIQAYYCAHRVMGELGVATNPGNPHAARLNRRPSSVFNTPDIVAVMNGAARAAIAAIQSLVWNVHLRPRPEAAGGLVHLALTRRGGAILKRAAGGSASLHHVILSSAAVKLSYMRNGSNLLSQAWPEGAPAHPSYPSDRGAVAGACVTVLKYFYDCEQPYSRYAPVMDCTPDGLSQMRFEGVDAARLTFNIELSKLGHNIAFGHGLHAGAHWRSDVEEAMLLGEAAAIAYLQAQAQNHSERFSVTIRKFDGELEKIG